jgi:hypothetical protein
MSEDDVFDESVPDGICNAIWRLYPEIPCCGQDGYELLVMTFGPSVNGERVKRFTEDDCERMARAMQSLFGLRSRPSSTEARDVISRALAQWGGGCIAQLETDFSRRVAARELPARQAVAQRFLTDDDDR